MTIKVKTMPDESKLIWIPEEGVSLPELVGTVVDHIVEEADVTVANAGNGEVSCFSFGMHLGTLPATDPSAIMAILLAELTFERDQILEDVAEALAAGKAPPAC